MLTEMETLSRESAISTEAEALILASASPRRRELLERLGFRLQVEPGDVDETWHSGEEAAAYAARIAGDKSSAVRARFPNRWVLAADTVVILDGSVLGKAATPGEAREMIRSLQGRTHVVATAYVVCGPSADVRQTVQTEVALTELSDAAVDEYVATGEWKGKAGAYAVQGIAAAYVSAVRGSITNVIGLPLAEVIASLRECGGPGPMFDRAIPA